MLLSATAADRLLFGFWMNQYCRLILIFWIFLQYYPQSILLPGVLTARSGEDWRGREERGSSSWTDIPLSPSSIDTSDVI